jgi:hypothetical protein
MPANVTYLLFQRHGLVDSFVPYAATRFSENKVTQQETIGGKRPNKAGMPGWAGAGRFARAYGLPRDDGRICLEATINKNYRSRAWPEYATPLG